MGEKIFQEKFESYVSSYIQAKVALDTATDNYLGIDEDALLALNPGDYAALKASYEQAQHDFERYSSGLASFVVSYKDFISFNV